MKKVIIVLLGIVLLSSCSNTIPIPKPDKFISVVDGDTIVIKRCFYETSYGYESVLITDGYKTINYQKGKRTETIFVLDTDTIRHITGQIISENDSLIIFKKKR